MIPASDPAMAAATVLGESKVLGPAGKHEDIIHGCFITIWEFIGYCFAALLL